MLINLAHTQGTIESVEALIWMGPQRRIQAPIEEMEER
jgi:hypothetical protein